MHQHVSPVTHPGAASVPRSWIKALASTLTGSYGSAQCRFVARQPGADHGAGDHVVTGATFPVMRLQDLDDPFPSERVDRGRAGASG